MSELIDRQAALDALDKRFDNIPMEQTAEILMLRKDLRELPTIQPEVLACGNGELVAKPEPQWIPVSERLPDTNRDVLLQFSTSMGVGFWEHNSWGVNTGDNIYSEIGEGEAQPIAWMPLPEAYKPNK